MLTACASRDRPCRWRLAAKWAAMLGGSAAPGGAAAVVPSPGMVRYCVGTALPSSAAPPSRAVGAVAGAARAVAGAYARRCLADLFVHLPPSVPLGALGDGAHLRQLLHVGLATERFGAAEAPGGAASTDFRECLLRVLCGRCGAESAALATRAIVSDCLEYLSSAHSAPPPAAGALAAAGSGAVDLSSPACVLRPFAAAAARGSAGGDVQSVGVPGASRLRLVLSMATWPAGVSLVTQAEARADAPATGIVTAGSRARVAV